METGPRITDTKGIQKEIDIMQKKQQPKEPMGKGKGPIRKRGKNGNC